MELELNKEELVFEKLTLYDELLKDKVYSIYVDVKGNEGYGDSDPYECWNSVYSGIIKCTKDIKLTSDLLENNLSYGWNSFKLITVEFKDVTELYNEMKILTKECDNFDWNNKSFEEWKIMNDKINEIDNIISPHYIGCIFVDKTI